MIFRDLKDKARIPVGANRSSPLYCAGIVTCRYAGKMQFPQIVGNHLTFVVYLLLFEKFYSLIGPPVEQAVAFHCGGRGSCPILGKAYKLRPICQDCRTKCSIF